MTALVLVLGVPGQTRDRDLVLIIALISLGGIARRLQIGTLDGLFTFPEVLAKTSASISVRIAVTLFANSAKLLGSYL